MSDQDYRTASEGRPEESKESKESKANKEGSSVEASEAQEQRTSIGEQAQAAESVTVTPHALRERLAQGEELFFLDVRDPDKYAAGSFTHESGRAVNFPYAVMQEEAAARTGAESWEDKLPRKGRIVTVCTTGGKAGKAAALLRSKGFDAVSLEGGLTAWKAGESEG
ncbi:rhodanese-like domain-containing protein [Paenibacillus aurantius]|uniref:Rhodanese-like domain-containing protein n=1 Tax=Paenibacillus aurantius TaxID=2918900 RepID=A0AA96LH21_9BACL|nr:rhodanese-like domain-containing protein [Paenibacillus aurantius]WNQ11930.1 rhodanese-like domain-containing protein [Paenibacillus aurantius]